MHLYTIALILYVVVQNKKKVFYNKLMEIVNVKVDIIRWYMLYCGMILGPQ